MEINSNLKSYTTEELQNLVIKAAEEFYLNINNDINIPDIVYDEMLDELKSRIPDFNIFEHLKLVGRTIKHSSWFPLASKTKLYNGVKDIIPVVNLKTFKDLAREYIGDEMQSCKCTMLHAYFNGTYKYSMVIDCGVLFGNPRFSRVAISDYQKGRIPNKLYKGQFRLVSIVDICDPDNPTIIGVSPELDTETPDWTEIRKAIIQSEYFANINLLDNAAENKEYNDRFKPIEEFYQEEKWLRYVFVDPRAMFTPKMDGCSSVTYYNNGVKQYTCSRSDDVHGKDKTEYFSPFIPDRINFSGKVMLMHELVIDLAWGFGWNSRQKANGLTNSKYSQDQLGSYATWVIYDAKDGDGNRIPLSVVKKFMQEAQNVITIDDVWNVGDELIKSLNDCPITKEYLQRMLSLSIDSGNLVILKGTVTQDHKNEIISYGVDKNYLRKFDVQKEEYKVEDQGLISGYRFVRLTGPYTDIILLNKINLGYRVRTCDEFQVENIDKFIDTECQAYYHHSEGGTFLCDGICLHEERMDKRFNKITPFHNIFKYDYNEVAKTKVIRIDWIESEFGSFIPTVVFDTVQVEGSYLSKASIGGWNLLKAKKCGVGAEIEVVRINSTIPQVLRTVTPVDPQPPVCPHCGRQLTEQDDLISGVFKCSNQECPGKLESKKWFLDESHEWEPRKDILDRLIRLTNIERYGKGKRELPDELINRLFDILKSDKYDEFVEFSRKYVFINMTLNNIDGFNYGIKTAYRALRIKLGYADYN